MNQQSFNRYAYCMYNPLKYVDPTGERYYGYSEAYIYKLMEEIQKNVFREWYSVYEISMASNLFSQGLGENGNCKVYIVDDQIVF